MHVYRDFGALLRNRTHVYAYMSCCLWICRVLMDEVEIVLALGKTEVTCKLQYRGNS